MSENDQITIWGGVPRFSSTPTIGQAIAGNNSGFVIYDSAEDNTGVVPAAGIPLPNKNMELAQKTVAGVNSKYYGFAGYCGSFYSQSTQANSSAHNLIEFDSVSVLYLTNVLGSPLTKLTALYSGVYKISGTIDFFCDEVKTPINPVTQWSDIALEVYTDLWIRKNGSDIAWTKRAYKMIGDYPRVIANIDYIVDLNANDYIEIVWESASANTKVLSASTDYPSALINMNLVR